MFPLGSCLALPRIGSDNTLILWDLSLDKPVKPNSYKFEKWLLLREAFRDLVEFFSNEPVNCNSSIDTWQTKIRKFRRVTKGWNFNIEANLRKLKKYLMEEYDHLDLKSESSELSEDEKVRLKLIHDETKKIWHKEETKAKHRSRDRHILEGDRNTAYFHAVTDQRRRNTFIHSLDGSAGPVTEINYLLGVASDYYKDL